MATGTIKSTGKSIIAEKITVCSQVSTTTYYATYTKAVSKSGYTAVGIVGLTSNQGQLYEYSWKIENGTITVAVLARAGSGTISNLSIEAYVLWIKNELL